MIWLYYLLCALSGYALVHAGMLPDMWEWWVLAGTVVAAYSIGYRCGRKKIKEENKNANR